MKHARRSGFTIIELLVVISIIVILIGLLSTGISAAISTGKRTKEMNRLKQVMYAWTMYSGQYEDKLLPGFLDPNVQQGPQGSNAWQVRYRNKSGKDLAPELCQTYPWRLAPYFDFNYEPIMGYRADSQENLDVSLYTDPGVPANLPASLASSTALEGAGAALQPGFGYNAYYVGGWWTSVGGLPTLTFGNDGYTQIGSTGVARGRLIARTIANIPKPSELIVFTASTFLNQSATPYSKLDEFRPGAAWVVPHRLGPDEIWGFGGVTLEVIAEGSSSPLDPILAFLSPSSAPKMQSGDIGKLLVFKDQAIPFDRYGKMVSVGNADCSVKSASMTELNDIRLWIPCADAVNFTHAP